MNIIQGWVFSILKKTGILGRQWQIFTHCYNFLTYCVEADNALFSLQPCLPEMWDFFEWPWSIRGMSIIDTYPYVYGLPLAYASKYIVTIIKIKVNK